MSGMAGIVFCMCGLIWILQANDVEGNVVVGTTHICIGLLLLSDTSNNQ